VSTTALQALNLLNGPLVIQQAERWARRLEREAGPRPKDQVERAFWLGLGRAPSGKEAAASATLVAGHGLEALTRALLNCNEFVYLP
jgi:hypothetical protein